MGNRDKEELILDYVKLDEIVTRILDRSNYYEISRWRLTNTLFLIDWKYLIKYKQRILNFNWKFGGYTLNLINELKELESKGSAFILHDLSAYKLKRDDESYQLLSEYHQYKTLTDIELHVIDTVVYETEKMSYKQFLDHVNSNYALLESKKNAKIDIVAKANEYLSKIKPYT